MNLRVGPEGPDAFAANEFVECSYVPQKRSGSSRKFFCATGTGTVLKVRYGSNNREVVGSVLASRLLWALGFDADRIYPVKVSCRGCSSDPWTSQAKESGTREFEPAAIELKPVGHEMNSLHGSGWAWSELARVDERRGDSLRAERDALRLLAVFMQHTDTKPEQQRLVCLQGGLNDDGVCEAPFLALHDVGLTFGHANYWNRTTAGSVNFAEWSRTPIWRDPAKCIGQLSKSHTGTLDDPHIGEAGRAFLAGLLDQLSGEQLRSLFEVAGVDRVEWARSASIDDWVTAFKEKREEISRNHCPS